MRQANLDTEQEILVFLHILKTAGQTLMPILEKNFSEGKIYFGNAGDLKGASREELNSYDLIMGHNFHGIHQNLDRTPVYITFLRDPVDRTISHYYYLKRAKGNHLYPTVKKQNIMEFLTDPVTSKVVKDFQVRWLIAENRLKQKIDDEEGALNLAMSRLLEFPFFGITDQFSDSVMLLTKTFGWPYVTEIDNKNIGGNRPKREEVEPEVIEKIESLVQLDSALYQQALDVFNQRIEKLNSADMGSSDISSLSDSQGVIDLEREIGQVRKKNYELSLEVRRLKQEGMESKRLAGKYSQELYEIKHSPAFRAIITINRIWRKLISPTKKVLRFLIPQRIRGLIRNYILNPLRMREIQADSARLREIIELSSANRGIVVFPPSIEWDAVLFQRPQQMAKAFAKLGYLVFYSSNTYNKADLSETFVEIDENLFVTKIPLASIAKVVSDPILFLFTYNDHWKKLFSEPFVIYEQLDELEVFDGFPISQLEKNHSELVQSSDIVVGISDQLTAKLREVREDSILNTNGVDFDHFANLSKKHYEMSPEMEYIVGQNQPIVGYYGALARWLDYELLDYAAEQLDGTCQFVFIGPSYDGTFSQSNISERANVHALPPVNYLDLPGFLKNFTIATIPFRVNELTNAVSPLKLFEYMAGGKPIVTTAMKECEKYEGVLISHDHESFVENIYKGIKLADDGQYINNIRSIALANSWDNKAKQLSEEILKRRKKYDQAINWIDTNREAS